MKRFLPGLLMVLGSALWAQTRELWVSAGESILSHTERDEKLGSASPHGDPGGVARQRLSLRVPKIWKTSSNLVVTNLALEKWALYRNNGGRFSYATLASGLAALTARSSGWGVSLYDFDDDGSEPSSLDSTVDPPSGGRPRDRRYSQTDWELRYHESGIRTNALRVFPSDSGWHSLPNSLPSPPQCASQSLVSAHIGGSCRKCQAEA